VVSKIGYLRQDYHFGLRKIAMYLARYHEVTISSSGVWRILKRIEMNKLPSSQRYKRHDRRWKRYEKQLPGHRVQVDVKFIDPPPGVAATKRKRRYNQFTPIDCTRIRVLRIYERNHQKTAIQFMDYVLAKLPIAVEVVQTDSGAEFQGAFHWHLLDRGIGHTYIKPKTPRLNGRSSAPTASTRKSSTDCSTAWSLTPPKSSTRSFKSGRTSTTSIDPTAASTARLPTIDSETARPRTRRNRPTSAAHSEGFDTSDSGSPCPSLRVPQPALAPRLFPKRQSDHLVLLRPLN
jgi:hypothetical protein